MQRAGGLETPGSSNFNSIGATIKAKYIVHNGIRIASDFVPETFGRLTTIGPVFWMPIGIKHKRRKFQVCQCSCGALGVYRKDQIESGGTCSCGCYNREIVKKVNTKHGASQGRCSEYTCWENMRVRCRQGTGKYHKRGIRVCDRWRDPVHGYTNFLADMGNKPSAEYTIEREDNDGDYCPENCVWATMEVQARNKTSNVVIHAFGISMIIADWSKYTGLPVNTIKARIRQSGWPPEIALSTPTKNVPNPRRPDA